MSSKNKSPDKGAAGAAWAGWKVPLQALVILAAVLWIYWPVINGDWIWDDVLLVTKNPLVQDPAGLWKIWLEPGRLVDFQPITISVFWLQWQLWGNVTLGYHLTNMALHGLSALLVWRLLGKFGLRLAWLGGLIFAVHPVMVESVAWISELKNTLSLPPFLLAMCAWIDYDRDRKWRDYLLAAGLFLAAMLGKATMVMFPVVILLYAWWRRSRIGWSDLKSSGPFFLLSLALGLLTVWFLHQAMGEETVHLGGFLSRLACAGLAISFYFIQCVLPVGLLPMYPKWVIDPPTLLQFLPWPVMGGLFFWFWRERAGWGRHVLLGLGFFVINLAPFAGFTAGSYMAFTWVADHVLYLPIIGLIGLAVAGLERAVGLVSREARAFVMAAVVGVVVVLAWGSRQYAEIFGSQEALWSYTIKHNPGAYVAQNNLGIAYSQQGRVWEAIARYEEALRIHPHYAEAHSNLGAALVQVGRVPDAMAEDEAALRIDPSYADAHNNLGNALLQAGRIPEAISNYEAVLRIDPEYAEVHNNLGNALLMAGRIPEAISHYEAALRIDPNDASRHINLGNALLQAGRVPEAIEQYDEALRIKPDNADAHNNRGFALERSGRVPEAIAEYAEALRLRPDYAMARSNLARLQASRKPSPAK